MLVERGAVVRKDQELVRLASGVEEAAQAAANYRARMEGQVRSAENKVSYLREKLRRREDLVRQSFVSSQDRDDTQSELRIAEADLVVAKDDRELASLESRRQAELLQQRRLLISLSIERRLLKIGFDSSEDSCHSIPLSLSLTVSIYPSTSTSLLVYI